MRLIVANELRAQLRPAGCFNGRTTSPSYPLRPITSDAQQPRLEAAEICIALVSVVGYESRSAAYAFDGRGALCCDRLAAVFYII